MKNGSTKSIPVRRTKCRTCPFRHGSGTEYLADSIGISALTEASRFCHSTGSNNAFHRRTGKPVVICRGARDLQLRYLAAIKFLSAPTDAAWDAKARELGMVPNACRHRRVSRRNALP